MQIKFSDYNAMKVESNSNNNNNESIMVASFRVTDDPWLVEFHFCALPFCIVIVDLFTNRLWCKSSRVCLRLGDKGHRSFLLLCLGLLVWEEREEALQGNPQGKELRPLTKAWGITGSPRKSPVSKPPWAESPNLLHPSKPRQHFHWHPMGPGVRTT